MHIIRILISLIYINTYNINNAYTTNNAYTMYINTINTNKYI